MTIEPGLAGVVHALVGGDNTAVALGSGDVEVLGTPAVVALCERAAVNAVADALEDGSTTVGARIAIDHVAATPVGGRVTARARLEEVDGRMLRFSVSASDDGGEVARGEHTRVVVDRGRFVSKAADRLG